MVIKEDQGQYENESCSVTRPMSRKVNGCIITIAHYSLSASKRNFHNAVLLNSFIETTITEDDSWQIL